jgi:hypothetical protein
MSTEKNKAGRKSTEASYEERIPEAFQMILYERLNSIEFRKEASKRFGISERAADSIWSEVKTRIKKRFEDESEEILQLHLQRYFDLLQRAKESGNRRVEREVLDSLTKLYGLETKKLDITSNGEQISININLQD